MSDAPICRNTKCIFITLSVSRSWVLCFSYAYNFFFYYFDIGLVFVSNLLFFCHRMLQYFLFSHIMLLESHINKLCNNIDKAISSKKNLVRNVYEVGWIKFVTVTLAVMIKCVSTFKLKETHK